jgi:hypothetical protein
VTDLKSRIAEDVKSAMRSRDRERLGCLRLVQAAIKQREVDERIALDDAQVLAVLDKLGRQYRDSIEQFAKAGRADLVAKETMELSIVQSYLPQQLSETEISAAIDAAVAAAAATSIKEMGAVMARLKPQLQGRADLGKVGALVKQRLSGA